MPPGDAAHVSIDEWIARDAIAFTLNAPERFAAAVDGMMEQIGGGVKLLAFGEALHGGEDLLVLRNRLFQRLVETHGFTAIAVESSFPRGRIVNEYLAGRNGLASYDAVRDAGFSHGFGALDANRELIEWMKRSNGGLRFYGFDGPTEMMFTDSPRQLLHVALDYLGDAASQRRQRIDELLGDDAGWANPAANMDPSKSIGLSPAASSLRNEVEDLITDLEIRRPELAPRGENAYAEALQHARGARQLLTYHAAVARPSDTRIADLLGLRDLMMADNLVYVMERERVRGGRVLAFAHNSHLKRGKANWQLGPHALAWWPAGAHVAARLGAKYVVIGSAVGSSDANAIGQPEPGTLEHRLTSNPGPGRFIPTQAGRHLPPADVAALPVRSASQRNQSYFPLTRDSFTDFDWLAVLDSTTYTRGGPPLP